MRTTMTVSVLLLISIFLGGNSNAIAQSEEDMRAQESLVVQNLRDMRAFHREKGDPTLKSLERRIQVVVEDSPVPTAGIGSISSDGRLQMRMTGAYRQLVNYIADVGFIQNAVPSSANCMLQYRNHIFNSLKENRQRLARNGNWVVRRGNRRAKQ